MDATANRINRYFASMSLSSGVEDAVRSTSLFLDRPIAIIDTAMNHVAHYPDSMTGDGDWDSLLTNGHVEYDYASITRKNHEKPTPPNMLHRCIFSPANEREMAKYRCSLLSGSIFLGGMMVLSGDHPFENDDLLIIQLATQTLAGTLCRILSPQIPTQNAQHHFFRDLLEGNAEVIISSRLKYHPDLVEAEGKTMYAGFADPTPADFELSPFWQRTLTAYFPDVQVIQYKNSLVFFFPAVTAPHEAFTASLSAHLAAIHLRIGLSDPFHSMLDFKQNVENARQALYAGMKKQPQQSLYPLRDYRLQLMLGRFKESGGQMLSHPAAARLRAYDRENGTDYCRILHAYLFNYHNYSLAAKALFMHRNTLTYHVERIRALLPVDLDDPATCYELLVSLSME